MTDKLTIKLTPDEAYTLRIILDRVGGDPVKSRRGHADSINNQLVDAGVEYCNDLEITQPGDAIWFSDNV